MSTLYVSTDVRAINFTSVKRLRIHHPKSFSDLRALFSGPSQYDRCVTVIRDDDTLKSIADIVPEISDILKRAYKTTAFVMLPRDRLLVIRIYYATREAGRKIRDIKASVYDAEE